MAKETERTVKTGEFKERNLKAKLAALREAIKEKASEGFMEGYTGGFDDQLEDYDIDEMIRDEYVSNLYLMKDDCLGEFRNGLALFKHWEKCRSKLLGLQEKRRISADGELPLCHNPPQ